MRTRFLIGMYMLAVIGAANAQAEKSPPVAGNVSIGVPAAETSGAVVGYRASKFIGSALYNDNNERIGTVGDVILKPDGSASYAIVNVGRFLGTGNHDVAIPIGQLTHVHSKMTLPGATRDALKRMPQFRYASSAR